VRTELLRALLVDPAVHPRGQPHLSAASGLALSGQRLWLAADDEHHLGVLDLGNDTGVQLLRVVEGDLPHDAVARKRSKRDFEAVALLPPHGGYPHGALLVLGSGSKPNRQHVLRLALDASGAAVGEVQARETGPLLEPLREHLRELNIEGAFVQDSALCLLHRGNRSDPRSAFIRLPLRDFLAWMEGENAALPRDSLVDIVSLGEVQGIPLAFTDGAALADGSWLFSAVAEDAVDSYADGPCVASAIGRVAPDGTIAAMEFLEGSPKVEGIAVDGARVLLVTDADDPDQPSELRACTMTQRLAAG
jgi:hypothetical protein